MWDKSTSGNTKTACQLVLQASTYGERLLFSVRNAYCWLNIASSNSKCLKQPKYILPEANFLDVFFFNSSLIINELFIKCASYGNMCVLAVVLV